MAYNLNPFIASRNTKKVHVVSDYMGLTIMFYENIVAKANKNRLVVLRKTSSVSSYKV